jgi:gamma-glutamyl phosphate reductase
MFERVKPKVQGGIITGAEAHVADNNRRYHIQEALTDLERAQAHIWRAMECEKARLNAERGSELGESIMDTLKLNETRIATMRKHLILCQDGIER